MMTRPLFLLPPASPRPRRAPRGILVRDVGTGRLERIPFRERVALEGPSLDARRVPAHAWMSACPHQRAFVRWTGAMWRAEIAVAVSEESVVVTGDVPLDLVRESLPPGVDLDAASETVVDRRRRWYALRKDVGRG